MRACFCTIFKCIFAYHDNIIKKTYWWQKIGKAAKYVTPTARQPAHARGVLAQYDSMSPPMVRMLAFARHVLSSSFLNITNYKYMHKKRRNRRSLHAHSPLTFLCRRYVMAAMLDAHWYLLRLLLPFFSHNVTGLGHTKQFGLKNATAAWWCLGPQALYVRRA